MRIGREVGNAEISGRQMERIGDAAGAASPIPWRCFTYLRAAPVPDTLAETRFWDRYLKILDLGKGSEAETIAGNGRKRNY
jgi:hypothetical protein